ncbi:MAG: radical SAM protein [Clostridia bacterium]|nr:radical SAM protein [Clostridia bacterium]
MTKCTLCPRACNIDRSSSLGYCKEKNILKIAKASLHFDEEPIISGKTGSGTIFFSGCNLKCVYCQNHDISHDNFGKNISTDKLADIFKKLENQGATNINLVTPTHFVDKIIEALKIYRPHIPIVYNTNSYESISTLEKLAPFVDIYLADIKYFDSDLSNRLSKAKDYFEVAMPAILKMRENVPKDIIENGLMKKGLIIRHLVLPNHIDDSKKIFDNLIKYFDPKNTIISLMGQYTPMYKAHAFQDINRPLKPLEYKIVQNYILNLGFDNGYFQELSSATSDYTPAFDLTGIDE